MTTRARKTIPEADPARTREYIPPKATLAALAEASKACQGCPLFLRATQTVFGEGPRTARVVLVGEQPGDVEDRRGHPFVGPSGQLLDQALVAAGLPRADTYVTNAVKHFSFEERGKRRLHKRPTPDEVNACRPWLEAELAALKPQVLVLLGATAAQAILGRRVTISRERGRPLPNPLAPTVLLTTHPAAVLREPDPQARQQAFKALVHDLQIVVKQLDVEKRQRAPVQGVLELEEGANDSAKSRRAH